MTENPASVLEDAFRAVYEERMQGLPFINPALSVEAIDVQPWNGHWLGVLITPWFMNLMLLPDSDAAWPALRPGEKCEQIFPAGIFEFIAGREDTLGEYLACSLFSPMFDFADHETARLTAAAARAALFDATNLEQTDIALYPRVPEGEEEVIPDDGAPGPIEVLQENLSAPISRREFLQGGFLPVDRGSGG
ncbi:MAG TPA: [NiFe]-hydrogenase assembly chaperone HybE [Casimicrobiaceae bacterium]|nr:[NiFe]-hydrogenase assembly chaperone HybE [Casimicrobiaceae bacterium]